MEEFDSIEDILSFESTGVDHSETIKDVHNGNTLHFVAKVTAEKNDIELGSDYLGSCIYDSYKDFYNEDSVYFNDMVNTVIAEANDAIKSLCS